MITAFFDGACEPTNPGGHAAYGVLVKIDDEIHSAFGRYVGQGRAMSNNVAEFSGMIEVLRIVEKLPGPVQIYGDSKLVIYTLTGHYQVHGGLYVPYFNEARRLFDPQRERIRLQWISRDQNLECDELSKGVLRARGVRFRIQPESKEDRKKRPSSVENGVRSGSQPRLL